MRCGTSIALTQICNADKHNHHQEMNWFKGMNVNQKFIQLLSLSCSSFLFVVVVVVIVVIGGVVCARCTLSHVHTESIGCDTTATWESISYAANRTTLRMCWWNVFLRLFHFTLTQIHTNGAASAAAAVAYVVIEMLICSMTLYTIDVWMYACEFVCACMW